MKEKIENFSTGYTLVEILVVVSIISMIGVVAVYSYRAFNDRLALTAAEQEIALAIRQAQSYALSVKQTSSGDFSSGYGVAFDISNDNNVAYYIFADKNVNGVYNGNFTCNVSGECVEKIPLHDGVVISSVCGVSSTGVQTCSDTNVPPMKIIHIVFNRPNPEAMVYLTNGNGTNRHGPFDSGTITLRSPQEQLRTVTVERTGQVSVQ